MKAMFQGIQTMLVACVGNSNTERFDHPTVAVGHLALPLVAWGAQNAGNRVGCKGMLQAGVQASACQAGTASTGLVSVAPSSP